VQAERYTYQRREPEHTELWQCVREHWPEFLAQAANDDRTLPKHVLKEFEGFMNCGLLEKGFARVACKQCGFERLVAFSCKARAVCCSCVARRMSDTAAHLCDHVFPKIPIRQWVLSIPHPLRYLIAWDVALCGAVVGIFVHAVFAHLRRQAKHELGLVSSTHAHPGAVCMVQRWGGSLNLHPHLHALAGDGVFVQDPNNPEQVTFRALPEPSQKEIAAVADRVCARVISLLRKQGRWQDADPTEDTWAQQEPLLAQLYQSSIAGYLLMSPNQPKRPMRLYGAPAKQQTSDARLRNVYGFDLDAAVRIGADDRTRLERLARYTNRPPLSKDRFARQPDGRYLITFKTPWNDGSTHMVLDGVEVVSRLAALVPPPRMHLTRYFGVFAPRAKLREKVVPKCDNPDCDCRHQSLANKSSRTPWASLLARVFAIDILKCNKCGSRMQRVEWVTEEKRIREILGETGPPADDAA
jgi:hypothetical protein